MTATMRRLLHAAARAPRRLRPRVAGVIVALLVLSCGATTALVSRAAAQSAATIVPVRPVGEAGAPPATTAASSPGGRGAPRVPRPAHLVPATMLARQAHALRPGQLAALRRISGVEHVTAVSEGPGRIDGHHAELLAVDPDSFRPWTPKLTAASNPLWRSIASGELAASFDMGHGASLPLGRDVPVRSRSRKTLRIGAFATIGIAGVDGVVDGARGRALGLPQHNAVVISAPHADPLVLRAAVHGVLDSGGSATLLREIVVVRQAGEFMTNRQISTILHAAAGRVGKPYVWGAAGPNSFDCSGLVLWSFAHAGIAMPRVSQDQFFAGPHVSYADARPGDLLFWHYDPTDPTDVDHVAIYAGNGMMLVAPHTGLDVEYVPVPLDHLAGVVRVDPAVARQVG